jgi:hypothetical protein
VVAHDSLADVLAPAALEAARDLADHMQGEPVYRFVGGTAVRFWSGGGGQRVGELDVATTSLDVLPTSLNRSFTTAHWHLPNAEGVHYAALLHKNGTKVDVFTVQPSEPSAEIVPLRGDGMVSVPLRDPNTQLAVSTWWLERRVTTGYGFGSHDKAVNNVRTLLSAQGTDIKHAESLWRQWYGDKTIFAAKNMGLRAVTYWLTQDANQQGSAQTSLLRHRFKLLQTCEDCDFSNPDHRPLPGWRIALKALARKL